jgi:hypothetical protein
MLLDDDFAVERDVFDARIKVGNEERLLDMEMLECVFRLGIDLAGACRYCVEAKGLLQMCVADGRADGIRIRIAMTNDIDWFRAFRHILFPPKYESGSSRFYTNQSMYHYNQYWGLRLGSWREKRLR